MASKLNPSSTIVTRRKKRDLEAKMKSLKKLLEPSSGSRKKNIPRSISKKITTPKKTRSINRFQSYENSSEDGEYYPDKLKRKDIAKKIVLKPKHQFKVIIATTNKRKRGTPHKGIKSEEENLTLKNSTEENELNLPKLLTQNTESHKESNLKQVSRVFEYSRISPLSVETSMGTAKYGIISPPHRSLTELTVDDLMRMDEDSLSEDDLMEVLTCPSPVWWEDPPDYFSEGVLYLAKTSDSHVQNERIEETAEKTSNTISTSDNKDLKRTDTVRETKKFRKMAKLENILGNIKNRVQNKPDKNDKITDKEITDNKSKYEIIANDNGILARRINDKDETDHNLKKTSEENELKNENVLTKDRDSPDEVDDIKQRKISTSGSDLSVNDEDFLKNLENIDIPIHIPDTDSTEDNNKANNNSKANDSKRITDLNIIDLELQTTNRSADKKMSPSTKVVDSNEGIGGSDKYKGILNKLTDDILDVRLIKIPTNATNEVRIWSRLENFQHHNLKLKEFDKVHNPIDIENELAFSTIKCNSKTDPETICIDDDDDEQIKEVIDLDAIGKINDETDTNYTDMAEIIPMNSVKNIIKEDTIKISKDLDVRLIETPVVVGDIITPVCVDVITKPEQNNQAVIKQKVIEPPKPSMTQSNNGLHGIRILPMNMTAKLPNSNKNKKNKTRNKKTIQQNAKKETNSKINDNVIHLNKLDISIMKVNDHNVEQNRIPEVKNDLCITLVTSDKETTKRIVPSKTPVILPPLKRIITSGKVKETNKKCDTPVILPSLTKNPNKKIESPKSILIKNTNQKMESPKSINSLSSETDAEGTISDTNIQFLDEYDDDKRSVDIVFEGETINVENKDSEIKSKSGVTDSAEICIEKK